MRLDITTHLQSPGALKAIAALFAVITGIVLQLRDNGRYEPGEAALALAASELAEALLLKAGNEYALENLAMRGRSKGIAWQLDAREIVQPVAASGIPRLFEVNVDVEWSEGGPGRHRRLHFATLKLEQAK